MTPDVHGVGTPDGHWDLLAREPGGRKQSVNVQSQFCKNTPVSAVSESGNAHLRPVIAFVAEQQYGREASMYKAHLYRPCSGHNVTLRSVCWDLLSIIQVPHAPALDLQQVNDFELGKETSGIFSLILSTGTSFASNPHPCCWHRSSMETYPRKNIFNLQT